MRLGISSSLGMKDPEQWAKELSSLGCRTANLPVDYTHADEEIADYVSAAGKYDLVIAEVGAWCSPLSPDRATREAALERCKGQLRLADQVRACCCVNVSGSKGERWEGAYAANYTQETWEEMIRSIQEIIDAVNPQYTYYTIEPMQWMYPMEPDDYVRMLREVDRERFAVHMDVFNWVNSAERFFHNTELMEEAFEKLGPYIKTCHLKDLDLIRSLTLQITEVPCGKGQMNLRRYGELIQQINPEMPVILEHLRSREQFVESLDYVRKLYADIR